MQYLHTQHPWWIPATFMQHSCNIHAAPMQHPYDMNPCNINATLMQHHPCMTFTATFKQNSCSTYIRNIHDESLRHWCNIDATLMQHWCNIDATFNQWQVVLTSFQSCHSPPCTWTRSTSGDNDNTWRRHRADNNNNQCSVGSCWRCRCEWSERTAWPDTRRRLGGSQDCHVRLKISIAFCARIFHIYYHEKIILAAWLNSFRW